MDVLWQPSGMSGIGCARFSWTEVMEMDYQTFHLVRNKVIHLQNEDIKRLPKK